MHIHGLDVQCSSMVRDPYRKLAIVAKRPTLDWGLSDPFA